MFTKSVLSNNKIFYFDESKSLLNLEKSNHSNLIGHMVAVISDNVIIGEVVALDMDTQMISITTDFIVKSDYPFKDCYYSWSETVIEKPTSRDVKNEFVNGLRSISNVAKTMIDHYLHLQNSAVLSDEIKEKHKILEQSLHDLAEVTISTSQKIVPKNLKN